MSRSPLCLFKLSNAGTLRITAAAGTKYLASALIFNNHYLLNGLTRKFKLALIDYVSRLLRNFI